MSVNLGPVRIKSPDTHINGTAVGGGFKPQAETCSADAFPSGILHDFTREAFQPASKTRRFACNHRFVLIRACGASGQRNPTLGSFSWPLSTSFSCEQNKTSLSPQLCFCCFLLVVASFVLSGLAHSLVSVTSLGSVLSITTCAYAPKFHPVLQLAAT